MSDTALSASLSFPLKRMSLSEQGEWFKQSTLKIITGEIFIYLYQYANMTFHQNILKFEFEIYVSESIFLAPCVKKDKCQQRLKSNLL